VHIRDIAKAFLLALDAPAEDVNGKAFNVGATNANHQIRELAEVVASVIPGCEVELASDASPDTRNYRVNCDLFADTVGFRAEWDIERGARELYGAFRSVGLTLAEVEGPRFQRIAQIRRLLEQGLIGSDLRFAVPIG
jgi:nucleoside-diphosphate-sugar epimerase